MANYGPLVPDGDQTIVGTPTGTGAPWNTRVDDDPAAGQPDADWIANNSGATGGTTSIFYDFASMPEDFGDIDTMTVDAYTAGDGSRTDDDVILKAAIYKSDESTILTDLITLANWDAGGFDGGLKTGLSFTINETGLAASEADWNAARLYCEWTDNHTKGNDSLYIRIHAIELNGTYTAAAAVTVPVFWHHLNKNIGR